MAWFEQCSVSRWRVGSAASNAYGQDESAGPPSSRSSTVCQWKFPLQSYDRPPQSRHMPALYATSRGGRHKYCRLLYEGRQPRHRCEQDHIPNCDSKVSVYQQR